MSATTNPAEIKAQLEKQITQLILQKAQAREVLDAIEKQLPVLQGQLQLVGVFEQPAEVEEVPVD